MKLIMVEADGIVAQMAIFIVGNGFDCDLNPNGVGNAAIAIWGQQVLICQ